MLAGDLRRADIGLTEVLTFEEERFPVGLGQRITEAVPKIESSAVAALSEQDKGLPGELGLFWCHGFDLNPELFEKRVQHRTTDLVAVPIDVNRGFQVARRGNSDNTRCLDLSREASRFRFQQQNREQGGGIEDHQGIPSSS